MLHAPFWPNRQARGPFAEGRRRLRAVEGAVDLDRGQVFGGVGELARVGETRGG
jgi:hypothetical protein